MVDNKEYVSKEDVIQMIRMAEARIGINIKELKDRSTTDFISSQIASTAGAIDNMNANIKQIELKYPNIKDNVLLVDNKIAKLEETIAKVDAKLSANKAKTVPYIEDGQLKELKDKCNGLTYDLIATKLNMGVQNVGLYFNDKNKSQEGRRKIHKFLVENLDATV